MKCMLRVCLRHVSVWNILYLFFTASIASAEQVDAAQDSNSNEIVSDSFSDTLLYPAQIFLTSTRSPQPLNRVVDNVTIITREELNRWPVSDLDEALRMVSGIVVQDDGFIGQVATAQIYGSKEREVRVMIDGITFNPTSTGGIADLSQIPLEIVDRIEVIKGASSSIWGSAMGGVINIITRDVGSSWIPKGNLQASWGEFDTQRQKGELSGRVGPLRYFVFGGLTESDGARPHGQVHEKRAFLKGDLPLSERMGFRGSFGYSGSKVNEFEFLAIGIRANRKLFSHYGSLGAYFTLWDDKFHSDISYKISERTFRRDIELLPSRMPFQNVRARSLIHEVTANQIVDFTENQTLVFGTDIGLDEYKDQVIRLGTSLFRIRKRSTRQAYYTNYQLAWKRLDLTLGSRLDLTNNYGTNYSPSAGMAFHLPWAPATWRAYVARAFNAPSFVDRYLSAGTRVANPDLKAEYGIVYNTSVEADFLKFFQTKAVFFQNFLENSIQIIRRDDGLTQPVNVSKERRTGFEAELKLKPWHGLSASFNTVYVFARDTQTALQSRPRMTHDIKVNYVKEIGGFKFNAHLAGRHTDLVKYAGFSNPIDQTFIFDGKLMLTLPTLLYGNTSIFLIGRNLFSSDFAFDGSQDPWPKKNFEFGVNLSF